MPRTWRCPPGPPPFVARGPGDGLRETPGDPTRAAPFGIAFDHATEVRVRVNLVYLLRYSAPPPAIVGPRLVMTTVTESSIDATQLLTTSPLWCHQT